MNTTHRHKKPKAAKASAKKSTPPDARPTAKMPARRSESVPPRSWAYAEANTPEGEGDGAARKTAAAPSVGRVYGGENNVALPVSEKAAEAAPGHREGLKKPARR